mmetsp:Transcript_62048/g.196187  ORF Transcript_62048/g.196187 Transcript_62048/m.196187 type:complete len:329 (-) Transcript_62048:534-1520(-)
MLGAPEGRGVVARIHVGDGVVVPAPRIPAPCEARDPPGDTLVGGAWGTVGDVRGRIRRGGGPCWILVGEGEADRRGLGRLEYIDACSLLAFELDVEPEDAPSRVIVAHACGPAEDGCLLSHGVEPQPRAPLALLQLGEGLEQLRLARGRDAQSRVAHLHEEHPLLASARNGLLAGGGLAALAVRAGLRPSIHARDPVRLPLARAALALRGRLLGDDDGDGALAGELGGVGEQVHQHTLQPSGVYDHLLGDVRGDLKIYRHLLRVEGRVVAGYHLAAALDEPADIEGYLLGGLRDPFLHLRMVQNVLHRIRHHIHRRVSHADQSVLLLV